MIMSYSLLEPAFLYAAAGPYCPLNNINFPLFVGYLKMKKKYHVLTSDFAIANFFFAAVIKELMNPTC